MELCKMKIIHNFLQKEAQKIIKQQLDVDVRVRKYKLVFLNRGKTNNEIK